MKSTNLRFFFVFSILLIGFFGIIPNSAKNNIPNNQQFVYLVNKFNYQAQNQSSSISITTFNVAGSQNLTAGSSDGNFTIQYLYSSAKLVSYEFIKEFYNYSVTTSVENVTSVSYVSGTTQTATYESVNFFDITFIYPSSSNIADFRNDVAYKLLPPFILPVSGSNDPLWNSLATYQFPSIHSNIKQNDLTYTHDQSTKTTSNQFQVTDNSKIYGTGYATANDSTELSLTYDLVTGVLLGYKNHVSLDEQSNLGMYQMKLDIQIVRSDYQFTTTKASKSTPGFEVFSFFFSIFIISVSLINWKKKNP